MLPNVSKCMSLSVYLHDVIVISIFEPRMGVNHVTDVVGNGGFLFL